MLNWKELNPRPLVTSIMGDHLEEGFAAKEEGKEYSMLGGKSKSTAIMHVN